MQNHDGKEHPLKIYVETHGRKGKTVTIVDGLHHNPQTMGEVAKSLKEYCGAGGTVKRGKIEIQGDQREKLRRKLASMNYRIISPS